MGSPLMLSLADGVNDSGLNRGNQPNEYQKCPGQPVLSVGRLVFEAAKVVGSSVNCSTSASSEQILDNNYCRSRTINP